MGSKKHDAATKVVAAFGPVDLSAGEQFGDWVKLGLYDSVMVLYHSDAGTAGEDSTVKLRQAKTNAGGDAKDLDKGQWYAMSHANALTDAFATVGTAGEFTDDGETRTIARVEVTADQLDVNDDYQYVQVHASDPGATAGKLAAAVYVLCGARYAIEVPSQKSVL